MTAISIRALTQPEYQLLTSIDRELIEVPSNLTHFLSATGTCPSHRPLHVVKMRPADGMYWILVHSPQSSEGSIKASSRSGGARQRKSSSRARGEAEVWSRMACL